MDEPAIEGEVRILHENPWDRCDGDGRNGSVFSWRGGPISFLRDAVKHISDDVPDYGKSAEATVPEEGQFCVHVTDFRTPGQLSKRMAWVFRSGGRHMEDVRSLGRDSCISQQISRIHQMFRSSVNV